MLDASAVEAREHGPAAPWPVFVRALIIGLAFDLATFRQLPGLGIALFFVIVVTLTYGSIRRTFVDDALIAGAVALASFTALRASPPLVALDILAAIALLGLAATSHSSPSVLGFLDKGTDLVKAGFGSPVYLMRPVAHATRRVEIGRARPVVRAIAIGVPLLVIFGALLASADRVFARIITPNVPDWDAGTLFAQLGLVAVGAVGAGALYRAVARRNDRTPEDGGWSGLASARGRPADWMFVLIGIDALFAGFVAVQLAVLFGGEGRVRVTPGLTYAEYARTGFFQLIVVAVMTTLVILATWDFGRLASKRDRAWFRALVTVMIGLTGVILASALKRLALYEGAFGFTLARFTGYVVICLIGTFLVVTLVLVWTDARQLVVPAAIACMGIALLASNLIGPERFVAERNVARFHATKKIDAAYLGWGIGAGGIPAATVVLRELRGDDAVTLRAALCVSAVMLAHDPAGWRSANLDRARARHALEAARITPRSCATGTG